MELHRDPLELRTRDRLARIPIAGLTRRRRCGPPERHGLAIALNAFSLIASRVGVAAMGWLGTLIIVHNLSVRDWGRYSFVFAFLATLSIFTAVTSPRVVFRGLQDDDGTLIGTYVLLRLCIGLFAYAFALAFVSLGSYPVVVLYVTAVAGLAMIVRTVSYGYEVLFQYRLKLPQIAIAGALGQAVQLCLIVVLALTRNSLVAFAAPAVACEVVALMWQLYRLPREHPIRYRIAWRRAYELLKVSIPLAIGDALAILYYNVDMVMLSKLDTFHSVGVYAVAYKFAGVILIVPQAIGVTLYPIAIRYWPEQRDKFRTVIRQAARLYLVIGALITIEFVVFAPNAISLLYGHRYAVGAGAARLVVASECLGFFTSLATMTLVSVNRNRFYPLATLAGLVVNVVLNLILIPQLSYVGSAWATILTEALVVLALWVPVTRVTSARFVELPVVAKILFCAAASAGTAVALAAVLPWLLAAAIAAGVYVAATALTRVGGRGGLRSLIAFEGHAVAPG